VWKTDPVNFLHSHVLNSGKTISAKSLLCDLQNCVLMYAAVFYNNNAEPRCNMIVKAFSCLHLEIKMITEFSDNLTITDKVSKNLAKVKHLKNNAND